MADRVDEAREAVLALAASEMTAPDVIDDAMDEYEGAVREDERERLRAFGALSGDPTVGPSVTKTYVDGLQFAARIVSERADLLRRANRKKTATELDMLARDISHEASLVLRRPGEQGRP